jgi:hypothetical protein
MAKETALKYMVSAGIVLIIAGGLFSAFVSLPRMAMHPEIIKDGGVESAWFFSVILPLIAAAVLLVIFTLNRQNLLRIKEYLIVSEVALIILSMIIAKAAGYDLERYRFVDVAIPEFVNAGAYLIAGILLIIVSVKIRRSTSSEEKRQLGMDPKLK